MLYLVCQHAEGHQLRQEVLLNNVRYIAGRSPVLALLQKEGVTRSFLHPSLSLYERQRAHQDLKRYFALPDYPSG